MHWRERLARVLDVAGWTLIFAGVFLMAFGWLDALLFGPR